MVQLVSGGSVINGAYPVELKFVYFIAVDRGDWNYQPLCWDVSKVSVNLLH